jgi:nucleotide-binding universal stress UspA family protein
MVLQRAGRPFGRPLETRQHTMEGGAMLTLNKILVPYDFSSCAAQALKRAYRLAERSGAELHLLFVVQLHGEAYGLTSFPPGYTEEVLERLKELVRQHAGGEPPVPTVYRVVRDVAAGPPILNYAESHDIDLIVMGTHGRRGLRRFLMGSVAEEVVRLSNCPVLTLRERESETASDLSILVPIDFSDHSLDALRYAAYLAEMEGARLDLVHVIEEAMHPAFYNTGVLSVYDVQPDLDAVAHQYRRRLYRVADGPACEFRYEAIPGHPARENVRYDEAHGSDVIVLATHGLTGMDHFFIGSVAEHVVRTAPCPVFTVKAFGKSLLPQPGEQEAYNVGL